MITSKKESPADLIASAASLDQPSEQDSSSSTEPNPEKSLDEQKDECRLDQLKQQNKEASDTHSLRIEFAKWIFRCMFGVLTFIAVITTFLMFGWFGASLSDPNHVLKTLVGFTIGGFFSFATIAMKWLFKQNGNSFHVLRKDS